MLIVLSHWFNPMSHRCAGMVGMSEVTRDVYIWFAIGKILGCFRDPSWGCTHLGLALTNVGCAGVLVCTFMIEQLPRRRALAICFVMAGYWHAAHLLHACMCDLYCKHLCGLQGLHFCCCYAAWWRGGSCVGGVRVDRRWPAKLLLLSVRHMPSLGVIEWPSGAGKLDDHGQWQHPRAVLVRSSSFL